ncbi:hypothetical protein NU195Hw_g739t1 [Hortaea werneckii]
MHLTNTIATFITSAAVVNGLYFHIGPLTAVDIYNPTPSHRVDFTVNNPDAVYEQGGSNAATCSLTWYLARSKPARRYIFKSQNANRQPSLPQKEHNHHPNLLDPMYRQRLRHLLHPHLPDLQLYVRT